MSNAAYWRRPEPPKKPVLSLDDVGTRIEHYTQLLDLWDGARFILLAKSEASRSEREKDMIEFLTHAIELLKKNMTGSNSGYSDASLKKLVDSLPKDATEITD
jgi:hypothetical protein